YPESAGHVFRRFNLIALNVIYNKISDYLLDCAADFLLPNWIFLKDWMKGMAKKVLIYVYTKFIIPRIFSSRLPSIFRKHRLTPEDMV
ncbi:11532_t:CDS:2, partial [Rhizophagus irregularis]